MYAIKTEGLTKKYKNLTAVDNLNLTVEQGTVCALLGVNGAGKTTTIKMLTCLTKPYSGNAFLHNNSIISDVAAVKSIIGVSPQETAVAPNLSVKENLELITDMWFVRFYQKQTAIKNPRTFPAIRFRYGFKQKSRNTVRRMATQSKYCHGFDQ